MNRQNFEHVFNCPHCNHEVRDIPFMLESDTFGCGVCGADFLPADVMDVVSCVTLNCHTLVYFEMNMWFTFGRTLRLVGNLEVVCSPLYNASVLVVNVVNE